MEPKLLTPRPRVEFDEKGMHVLSVGDVIVDCGVSIPGLENWAIRKELVVEEDWVIRWTGLTPEYEPSIVGGSPIITTPASTTLIRVPVGFVYDGASLPTLGLVKLIAGRKEKYELAGLIHDLLYRLQAPKAEADYVFWLIASSGYQRVAPTRAWLAWAALRLFGGAAYRANGRKLQS